MGIIKKLAEKVLERELSCLGERIEKDVTKLIQEHKQEIEKLNEEIKKRDEKIAALQTVIENQSNDIIKLRRLTEKRSRFKRKKK